jgi:hypothetical protein
VVAPALASWARLLLGDGLVLNNWCGGDVLLLVLTREAVSVWGREWAEDNAYVLYSVLYSVLYTIFSTGLYSVLYSVLYSLELIRFLSGQ